MHEPRRKMIVDKLSPGAVDSFGDYPPQVAAVEKLSTTYVYKY